MSNNPSSTTRAIALRLPNDVYAILERRADKQKVKPSDYLRRRVVYDTRRSHKKVRKAE